MWTVVILAASAFSPELSVVGLASPASRIRGVDPASGVVAVVGPAGLGLRKPLEPSWTVDAGISANDVAYTDADGDGVAELWVCADDGLYAIAWDGGDVVGAAERRGDGCQALAAVEGGLWVSTPELALLAADGAGGFLAPVVAGEGEGEVWLESTGTSVVAAKPGGSEVWLLDTGLSPRPTPFPVAGLGVVRGLRAWSPVGDGTITYENGSGAEAMDDPQGFVGTDLAGLGYENLVVLHESTVELQRQGDPLVLDRSGWAGTPIAIADGSCTAVVALDVDGSALHVLRIADCGVDQDHDGDHYSVGEGDCDDTDPSVHPGANGTCESVDTDCDGVITAPPEFPTSMALYEGTSVQLTLGALDCLEGRGWTANVDGAVMRCTGDQCDAVDDGVQVVTVQETVEGSTTATLEVTVTVLNRPPVVDTAVVLDTGDGVVDAFDAPLTRVTVGDRVKHTFKAVDPGVNDVQTWTAANAPPSFVLAPDGTVDWTPAAGDEGDYVITIYANDGDGGEGHADFELSVLPARSCGGCGAAAGVVLLGVGSRFRRRALRPPGPRRLAKPPR